MKSPGVFLMIFKQHPAITATFCSGLALLLTLTLKPVRLHADENDDQAKKQKIEKMYSFYRWWFFPKAHGVTVDEFMEMKEENDAVLVDARSQRERGVSGLPGAITTAKFENQKENLRDKKIVVYCTIGFRSGRYSQQLLKQGFNAYNLIGGLLAWAHSGRLFVDQSGPTTRAHVYGRKWDLLPSGYASVY